jgi:tetratricopeptide (TPR) repeat protein
MAMEDKLTEEGDFLAAIERFTEAITLNRNNHQLFGQRSAAYSRIGRFSEALEDAKRCHELKPDWPKAYHRMGVAYQGLGRHEEALIAFSEGLAADSKQLPALGGIIDVMLKSPMKGNFQPKLEKFESLKLDRNPFIITSVVGQELLSAGKYQSAMKILEAAHNIGTDSHKLESSLLQALGKVHWLLDDIDKALHYMEMDLKICESMGDDLSVIRSCDNLGIALSSLGRHDEAIKHHSHQLTLSQSHNNPMEIINAYQRLGNAFNKIQDYEKSLNTYDEACRLAREIDNEAVISQCLSSIAETYIAIGDVDRAIHYYHQELQHAKELKNKRKEADAYSHLGHAYHLKGVYDQSMMFYQQLLSVAVQLNDMKLKAHAYGGMGQANRAMNSLSHAQNCREHQLRMSQDNGDEEMQLIALTHLGHVHRAANRMSRAMNYYTDSLKLSQKLGDKGGEAKAYSSLGLCHVALGNLREAVNYYKQELAIVQEREDDLSQANTHNQLGMAYLSLESFELSNEHLKNSLELAVKINDKRLQCVSNSNLGQYYTTKKEHQDGLSYLEQALKLSQELKDSSTESKVCHNLGCCHEGLGNYRQAIQYFQHDFMVAKESQDKDGMTKACEKLVKAHNEIGDKEQADVYQKKLLAIAEDIQTTAGKCTFWNSMAEESFQQGDYEKAIEFYSNLLKEAKKEQHQSFEGVAYRGLGNTHLTTGNYEHALSYFRHDLTLRKSIGDLTGECDAYFNLGTTHNSLKQLQLALECFDHQLNLARQLDNSALITKAYGCLGIVNRNINNFTNALHYHQMQLTTALTLNDNFLEQAGAYANLGDSFEAIGNYEEAAKNHEEHLRLAQKIQNNLLQIRALGSLGRAYRGLGSLRKSLGYFQQRLKLSKEINDEYIEAESYADIGNIHMALKEHTLALEAYSQQFQLSKSLEDHFSEALASCGLGDVHHRLGNYQDALEHHLYDLALSTESGSLDGEARALSNIADTYESLRDYQKAINYRERQLSVADTLRDSYIRALAFMGLGKTYLRLGEFGQAVSLLKQALGLIVKPNGYNYNVDEYDREAEAKIRFYLGQAFYHTDHNNDALGCLQKSLPLFEYLRENVRHYDHSIKQTLDLLPVLYQTLICILVKLNKVEEALEMAERERNRRLIDDLFDRDVNCPLMRECGLMKPSTTKSSWIQEAINTIQCPVLYYSIALNHVYLWLLHPKTGIVQFQHINISEMGLMNGSDNISVFSENSSTYVQPLVEIIYSVRESLGVEPRRHGNKSANSSIMSDDSLDDNESIISVGSSQLHSFHLNNSSPSGMSSNSSSPHKSINMQSVNELYDLLVHPVECALPRPPPNSAYRGQVIIVPDKDLYLVPFSLLRGEGRTEFLYQQFHLRYAPSLQSLISEKRIKSKKSLASKLPHKVHQRSPLKEDTNTLHPHSRLKQPKSPTGRPLSPSLESKADHPVVPYKPTHLVIGNPSLPINSTFWQPMGGAEKETKRIADLLEVKALTGSSASKSFVLTKLSEAESMYFATNVSWSHSHIVLSANNEELTDGGTEVSSKSLPRRFSGDGGSALYRRGVADGSSASSLPEPNEYQLSLSDLIDAKPKAKILVISGCHRPDSPRILAENLMIMSECLLASGIDAVLLPLWPCSFQGSRLMMNAFYSSLLYGSRASRALAYAMQVIMV